MNMEQAKVLYYEYHKGISLSDRDLIAGAQFFLELGEDLREAFGWAGAAHEATTFGEKLSDLYKQRLHQRKH